MEGPILLLVLTVVAFGLWIWAERSGAEWQRYIAGMGMAICFAVCGAGAMAVAVLNEHFNERIRLNRIVGDMLDRTIQRVEADERETLLADLREMRKQVQPTYEYWTFEEPFVEFARQKDQPSPDAEVGP